MAKIVYLNAEQISAEAKQRQERTVSLLMRLYRPLHEIEERAAEIEEVFDQATKEDPLLGKKLREVWREGSNIVERGQALSNLAIREEETMRDRIHLWVDV